MTVDHQNSRKLGFSYSFTYLYGFSFLLLFFALLPQVRNMLLSHGFRWLYIPGVSFLVALLVTPRDR